MQASDYHHFADQRDQILKCSGMYGVLLKSEEYYIDLLNSENRIVSTKVKIPQGLIQLFIEAMSNASDHVRRVRNKIKEDKITRIKNTIYDVGNIEVEVTDDTFTITNYGLPIPVERHKNGKWIPELIFGNLNSSSNYFGVRTGAGVNGYGAKLGNLFSDEYIVQIINRIQKKSYLQVWNDRMGRVEEPIIEGIESKGLSSVTISAKIKLSIFDMKEFSNDLINLFKKITFDTSFTTKIGVTFNGESFNFSRTEDYLKLYSIDSINFITHEIQVDEQSIEVVYFDSSENKIVSFVNSQITSQHGTHVDSCVNALNDYISSINKKFKKENVSINKKILRNYISLIVNFSSTDVQMNSQSKTTFQDKVFEFTLPASKIKKMEQWDLTHIFINLLNSKISRKMSKTDGKKSSNIKDSKAHDALYAGRRPKEMDKSRPRRLFFDEGNSADNFAHAYFDTLKNGRHYNGSLPLRGKIINPDGKSEIRVSDNKQIQMIKKLLGLKEGVDYSDDKNFKTLRYDQLVILTDEDYDGHHICGLILNIFERKFPSLLKRNDFILKLKTPLVIAEKKGRKKEAKVFFRMNELEEWKSQLDESEIKSWSFKYNKGLASIEVNEIIDYSNKFKMINLTHDETADVKLNMFFDKNQVNERKQWLSLENSENKSQEVNNKQLISNFIDNELKDFSYHSIERGIPQLIDGLKISQRQIVWTLFNKWTRKQIQVVNGVTQKELSKKVSQFSSEVSLFVDYHHGDDSLNKAISRMAQSFVNSNNLPFFYQNGAFGTRKNGEPGHPRYIKVKPLWFLHYIFREEDEQILEFVKAEDDVKDLHPKYLLPIIPLILVNGANGMGIGYRCDVPKYNIIDIINWLITKLSDEDTNDINLIPYYRNFQGSIVVEDSHFYSIGKFEFKSEEEIIITEIPIDFYFEEYTAFLISLQEQNKIVSFENDSGPNKPLYTISGFDIGLEWNDRIDEQIIKKFRLSSRHSFKQLTLLNPNLIPIEFKSINEILNEFFNLRLPFYQVRKDTIIPKIESEIQWLRNRIKFIKLVLENKIIWKNVPKKKLIEQLQCHELPIELIRSEFVSFTSEKIEKLKKKIKEEEERLEEIKNKPIEQMWIDELFELLEEYSDDKLNEFCGEEKRKQK